jgi:hypothetical protein
MKEGADTALFVAIDLEFAGFDTAGAKTEGRPIGNLLDFL